MANHVLAFRPAIIESDSRAEIARLECLRQHQIRFAMKDLSWRLANAPIAPQNLTKIATLQRLARLTIVPRAKPISIRKVTHDRKA